MVRRARPAVPFVLVLSLFLASPSPARAAEEKAAAPEKKEAAPLVEKVSRTRHEITLDGKRIPYTATAGTLPCRTRRCSARPATRVVTGNSGKTSRNFSALRRGW